MVHSQLVIVLLFYFVALCEKENEELKPVLSVWIQLRQMSPHASQYICMIMSTNSDCHRDTEKHRCLMCDGLALINAIDPKGTAPWNDTSHWYELMPHPAMSLSWLSWDTTQVTEALFTEVQWYFFRQSAKYYVNTFICIVNVQLTLTTDFIYLFRSFRLPVNNADTGLTYRVSRLISS